MKEIPIFKPLFAAILLLLLAACDSGSSSSRNSVTPDDDTDDSVLVAEPVITGRIIGDGEFTLEWTHALDDGEEDDQEVVYDVFYAEEQIEIDEDENGDFFEEDLSLDDLESRFDSLLGAVRLLDQDSPLTLSGLSNDTVYYYVITATTDVTDEESGETSSVTSDPSNEITAIPRAARELEAYRLNDTGYSLCGDFSFFIDLDEDGLIDSEELSAFSNNHNNQIDCINGQVDPDGDHVPSVDHQDALNGRDYLAAVSSLVKTGAGQAGFDFTKLDSSGNALDASAAQWSCVEDNQTGLIWESKTLEGLHNTDDRYTWYNDDILTNGGFEGYQLATESSSSQSDSSCFGFSEGDESTYCNSQAFVARVNAEGLCGANDWRLPTREEALSLVHFQLENTEGLRPEFNPSIDLDYFPNTEVSVVTDSFDNARYMTGSPYAADPSDVWGVFFGSGVSPVLFKGELNPIRLVRTAP